MLCLHYDPITTALLPYFWGLVYLSIFCWVRSELPQPVLAVSNARHPDELPQTELSGAVSNVTPPKVEQFASQPVVIRPEQVFQLLDASTLQQTQDIATVRVHKEAPQTTAKTPKSRKKKNLSSLIRDELAA